LYQSCISLALADLSESVKREELALMRVRVEKIMIPALECGLASVGQYLCSIASADSLVAVQTIQRELRSIFGGVVDLTGENSDDDADDDSSGAGSDSDEGLRFSNFRVSRLYYVYVLISMHIVRTRMHSFSLAALYILYYIVGCSAMRH
jgi:hypothetical protein